MTSRVTDLLEDAMQLPEVDRGELASRLLESLGPADDDGDAVWDAEIARRLGEIEAGDVRLIPWDEARRMIQEDEDGPGAG